MSVPANIAQAVGADIQASLLTSGVFAIGESDAPVWVLVAAGRVWIAASSGQTCWTESTSRRHDVSLEKGWTRDALRVGPWSMPLRRGTRAAADRLVSKFREHHSDEASDFERPPVVTERPQLAKGAMGFPDDFADRVARQDDEIWLYAETVDQAHRFTTWDGQVVSVPRLWAVSTSRSIWIAWGPRGDVIQGDGAAVGVSGRFRAMSQAPLTLRWAQAARQALMAGEVDNALRLWGEADQLDKEAGIAFAFAQAAWTVGANEAAVIALAEGVANLRADAVEEAARWEELQAELSTSMGKAGVGWAQLRGTVREWFDSLERVELPEGMPKPESAVEVWAAACAIAGHDVTAAELWESVEGIRGLVGVAAVITQEQGDEAGAAAWREVADTAWSVDRSRADQALDRAIALSGTQAIDADPERADATWWIRMAALRATLGADDGVEALFRALDAGFLHVDTWRWVLDSPVAISPEQGAWWRHCLAVLEPGAALTPEIPALQLDKERLEEAHPGGVGWLARMRHQVDTSETPDRADLVRGLAQLTGAEFELAHGLLKTACERLDMTPPQAFVYRGEGAFGCSAWPCEPPVLMVGRDHLTSGTRELADRELLFLMAVELAHLKCDHPLLGMDSSLIGTSRSIYGQFGRHMGTAENLIDVLSLVPGIDQLTKLQTIMRLSSRVFKANKAVDSAVSAATPVASWLGIEPSTEPKSVGREGFEGAALQLRLHADRVGLLVCQDLGAACRAVLAASSTTSEHADRVDSEGVGAMLYGTELTSEEALRLTALMDYASEIHWDVE
jgi:hypothetical protein